MRVAAFRRGAAPGCAIIGAVVPEARLERTEHGLEPRGEGTHGPLQLCELLAHPATALSTPTTTGEVPSVYRTYVRNIQGLVTTAPRILGP